MLRGWSQSMPTERMTLSISQRCAVQRRVFACMLELLPGRTYLFDANPVFYWDVRRLSCTGEMHAWRRLAAGVFDRADRHIGGGGVPRAPAPGDSSQRARQHDGSAGAGRVHADLGAVR